MNPAKITELPLGAVSIDTLIEWKIPRDGVGGVLANIIVVNTPQLLLSFFYVIYNGIYTSMCTETEWSSFATKRKGLRVSGQPQGQQRSTYFLQIPYRFGIPLMIMFAILHWLASESLFLVDVEHYERNQSGDQGGGWTKKYEEFTGGYSLLALVITIFAGTITVLALLISGLQKLKSPMPIVGNCSAVIAAACIPATYEEGEIAAESEVQWGVIGPSNGDVGHCGFSMHPVEWPEAGKWYA